MPYHIAIGEDVQAIDGYDYNGETEELYFIDSKTYNINHNVPAATIDEDDDDDVL